MLKRTISTRCCGVVDVRHEVRQTIGRIDCGDIDVLDVGVRGHSPVALDGHQHSFASRPLWEVPRWAEPGETEVNNRVDVRSKLTVIRHVDGDGQVVAHPRFHPSANTNRLLAARLIAVHTGVGPQPRCGLKDRETKLEVGSRERLFTQLLSEERDLIPGEERVATHTNLSDEPVGLSKSNVAVGPEVPALPQRLEAKGGLSVPIVQRRFISIEIAVDAENAIRRIGIAASYQAAVDTDFTGVRQQQPRVRGNERVFVQPERREGTDLGIPVLVSHSGPRLMSDIKVGAAYRGTATEVLQRSRTDIFCRLDCGLSRSNARKQQRR